MASVSLAVSVRGKGAAYCVTGVGLGAASAVRPGVGRGKNLSCRNCPIGPSTKIMNAKISTAITYSIACSAKVLAAARFRLSGSFRFRHHHCISRQISAVIASPPLLAVLIDKMFPWVRLARGSDELSTRSCCCRVLPCSITLCFYLRPILPNPVYRVLAFLPC